MSGRKTHIISMNAAVAKLFQQIGYLSTDVRSQTSLCLNYSWQSALRKAMVVDSMIPYASERYAL